MQVKKVELFHVAVPLRGSIKHASHERASSDNLIARVTLDDGQVGHGEGVPRSYVTGETVDTAFEALGRFDVAGWFGRQGTIDEAVRRIAELELPETARDPRGCFGNAARCALEIALLDACARSAGLGLGDLVARVAMGIDGVAWRPTPHPVRYSGAITSKTLRKEFISAWKMKLYHFAQVKIKVGLSDQADPERLARFRRILGGRRDLRLDANEAWSADQLLERVRPLLRFHPSVLEQPVPHEEVDRLAALRPLLGVPVMLDESLCGWPDAVMAIERGTADLLNVRLSKCGGFFPSLRIMGLAWRNGLGVQLGCHPGETGLLSAAGRYLASHLDDLRYIEGSYDRHVLARNVIREDVTFGYGGWAKPIRGPGLGVTVDPALLEAITVRKVEVAA